MREFKRWQKIPRWENEDFTATEKIDGTNACIGVDAEGNVSAYSRTRRLFVHADNFGFAAWVYDHEDDLRSLGEGFHYGEWWGKGIQRGYGLSHRVFSLFEPEKAEEVPGCCQVVPRLRHDTMQGVINELMKDGSKAAPGYMKPEGVIFRSVCYPKVRYKVIFDKEG